MNGALSRLTKGDTLADLIRYHMRLGPEHDITISEVTEHSNFNYVYRASFDDRQIFLKVVPDKPKRFDVQIKRERIFAEAEAIQRFKRLCGSYVSVPEVLFVDREHFVLGMADVGQGRQLLIDVVAWNYDLLLEQAAPLGRALGAVYSGSMACGDIRPREEEDAVRSVIFDGLLSPGVQRLFPKSWAKMIADMRSRRESLIHADLWGKNILVTAGAPPALIDFEGAIIGDPAYDLATLFAVSLIPVMQRPSLAPTCSAFVRRLLDAYAVQVCDNRITAAISARAFFYTAVFLAARGHGPFSYPMDEQARVRLDAFAHAITDRQPGDIQGFDGLLRALS